ncbi:MAG TPA: hypothetical protein VI282_16835, partial [Verrucomicrobiae bacterium]
MKSRLFLPILSMLAMCVVPNYAATAVLSEATETALRAAIAANDVVTIQCEGIILLTNTITISKSVILDATGRQNFGLSGSGSNRVIAIEQGVSAQLVNVSIVDGKAEAGGGILNAGTLLLSGCTLSNN